MHKARLTEGTEALKEIERWPAVFIERDDFAADHDVVREIGDILGHANKATVKSF